MSKPTRPSSPIFPPQTARTFFATTRTAGGRSLFQTDRMASLLIGVLRSVIRSRGLVIHEFVVMPNHLHVLMTVPEDMTVEKAMQLIKGGFSFRAKRELGFQGEIWQRGFSDVRIVDELSFNQHRTYIDNNPVKAGLADAAGQYRYCSTFLKEQKRKEAQRRAQ